jgi:hypothetical protein
MAGFKTVKVLINDDGTVEFDQIGYKGKECQNDIDDLIKAMGEEKSVTKKPEYYKEENVQIQQRF